MTAGLLRDGTILAGIVAQAVGIGWLWHPGAGLVVAGTWAVVIGTLLTLASKGSRHDR